MVCLMNLDLFSLVILPVWTDLAVSDQFLSLAKAFAAPLAQAVLSHQRDHVGFAVQLSVDASIRRVPGLGHVKGKL